ARRLHADQSPRRLRSLGGEPHPSARSRRSAQPGGGARARGGAAGIPAGRLRGHRSRIRRSRELHRARGRAGWGGPRAAAVAAARRAAGPGLTPRRRPPTESLHAVAEIEARDLVKRFGGVTAVDGVSFAVQPGETYGLLGPNGAGKTTTMRMLAGLSPITSGSLCLAGLDVRRHPRQVRALLGVVTQSDGLDEELTVRQNLEVFGYLVGLSRREAAARTDEVLEFFGVRARARDEIDELSGGMR